MVVDFLRYRKIRARAIFFLFLFIYFFFFETMNRRITWKNDSSPGSDIGIAIDERAINIYYLFMFVLSIPSRLQY